MNGESSVVADGLPYRYPGDAYDSMRKAVDVQSAIWVVPQDISPVPFEGQEFLYIRKECEDDVPMATLPRRDPLSTESTI